MRADELLATGDYGRAYLAARNAMLPLGRWKHEAWERTVKPLASPVTSPLAVSFDSLPEEIRFIASLGPGAVGTTGVPGIVSAAANIKQPGENLLPGGDFEDLSAMLQAGWRHFEHAQLGVQTSVELSPNAPYSGKLSLHLQARAAKPDATPTLVESTPLWITSAPAHVEAGDLVCIRGQVRVPSPIKGSVDGLMIIDSLGGQPLAERITETSGWRQFVLYRAAIYSGDMTLTFAMTGLGEASIDDVSVRVLRRH